ncbi:hypothetical protein GLOIN_2v1619029, partial [Rhizophagus irregularis DAOM 181602=DAOM 197198]
MLTSYITANTPRDINVLKQADADLLRPMTDKEIFANFICFIIYSLEHYPEVKQRLRQEFDRVFENDLTRPITYKDLDKLEYCDAVTKEINRHYPVAFFI